jgi:hypothetical protein
MLSEADSVSQAYLNISDYVKYHWELTAKEHDHDGAVLWTDPTKKSEEMLTSSQLDDV